MSEGQRRDARRVRVNARVHVFISMSFSSRAAAGGVVAAGSGPAAVARAWNKKTNRARQCPSLLSLSILSLHPLTSLRNARISPAVAPSPARRKAAREAV